MTKLITINYFGTQYKFESETNEETVDKASEIVTEVLTRISSDSVMPVNEKEKIAILISVALDIANENVRLQSTNLAMMKRITQLTEGLIKKIESKN